MIIFPAIDIRNGKCVRLVKGDFNQETVFSERPEIMAKKWEDEGGQYLHLVDLDGALKGKSQNLDVVEMILKTVNIPVELGGGIRTMENIKQVLQLIDIEIKNSKIKINIIDNFSLSISANKNEWMHIWLNLITNSIKSSKLHNMNNAQIEIIINENEIIFKDNCKGFNKELLKNIQKNKQKGLGLKMSSKILEKSNWSMMIDNFNNGAKITISKNMM